MAPISKRNVGRPDGATRAQRVSNLESAEPIAGIDGPGRWLVAEFDPTALFSLKVSSATSSVGRTLVIPTPYSIKMALVDAAFRAGLAELECDQLLQALAFVDVRVGPSPAAVVTHTFVKVRQESRDADPLRPYNSTIAYREVAYLDGYCKWAFDLADLSDALISLLKELLPHVSYIGKRGSFVRFANFYRTGTLSLDFTQPLVQQGSRSPPRRAHIAPLDDFGPEADLATLSSFTPRRPKRNQHRRFVETIIPIGIVNTGPGFTEYSRK